MNGKRVLISLIAGSTILTEAFGFNTSGAKVAKVVYSLESVNVQDRNLSSNTNSPYYGIYECLINDNVDIPLEDYMVPQGITLVDDYTLITSYDYLNEDYSIVYVLDKNGNVINKCSLNNKSHVGGIAFDKDNNLVWITGDNGYINAYDVKNILTEESCYPRFANLDVGEGLANYKDPSTNSVAYLTIYKGDLFVGSFSRYSSGLVKKYTIDLNDAKDKISLKYQESFKVPSKVQGMTFYNSGDNEYIIFSRSYGRNHPSVLQVFKYDDIKEKIALTRTSIAYEVPVMLEQVTISDDKLYALFESGALVYTNSLDTVDNVWTVDAEKLVKQLK